MNSWYLISAKYSMEVKWSRVGEKIYTYMMQPCWVKPGQLALSNVTDQLGTTTGIVLFGIALLELTVSVLFMTIHPSAYVVFWSQKVRKSLDDVTDMMNKLTASGNVKIILYHGKKQNHGLEM